ATEQIWNSAYNFEATILLRVMRGSYHRAGHVKLRASEVELISTNHPNVNYVRTLIHNSTSKSIKECRAGEAHIASNNHLANLQIGYQGTTHCIGNFLI